MIDRSLHEEAFARLVRLPEEQLDLARAALCIAGVFQGDLDAELYVDELDLMAVALADRVDLEDPASVLAAVNHYLFDELGFRGNQEAFDDPRNSFLNVVIERRLGIPISLSLVYIEVGRRVGLPLSGVGYPGHFLVRYTSQTGRPIFVDPFHGGRVLSEAQLVQGILRAGGTTEQSDQFLCGVTKRQILTRMLYNLKGVYISERRYVDAYRAVELLLMISPWNLDERRDRGRLAFSLRRYRQAVEDLEAYLQYCPDASDAARVREQLALIRRTVPPGELFP